METTDATTAEAGQDQKEKTFTEAEVNQMMTDRWKKEAKQSSIDATEFNRLKEAEEARIEEDQKKRGEYEAIIKGHAEKNGALVSALREEIRAQKVDGAIMTAATSGDAVSPDQVVALLKGRVKLSDDGKAEIVDMKGAPQFTKDGSPETVGGLVEEFLASNPHFKKARPGGGGSYKGDLHERDMTAEKLKKLPPTERLTLHREQNP